MPAKVSPKAKAKAKHAPPVGVYRRSMSGKAFAYVIMHYRGVSISFAVFGDGTPSMPSIYPLLKGDELPEVNAQWRSLSSAANLDNAVATVVNVLDTYFPRPKPS